MSSQMTAPVSSITADGFALACPTCRARLEPVGADAVRCPTDGDVYQRIDGVWQMLASDRAERFATFIQQYEQVRTAEGRGADDPAYYCALPYRDLSGRFTADWRIRARSFEALLREIVGPLESSLGRPLRVIDLGAGNGWLSNRLAGRGHEVAAVDLQVNPFDGLGAHVHYEATFLPVQAEFDHLPFPDASADLLLYNGAFHYSTDYAVTLSEGLRVLRPGGRLVIVDSPLYRNPSSGVQMVREREAQFQHMFGFPSNALASENFVTRQRLDDLGRRLGIRWRLVEPFYGLRWWLRPWRARLRGHREPARFFVISGTPVGEGFQPSRRPLAHGTTLPDVEQGTTTVNKPLFPVPYSLVPARAPAGAGKVGNPPLRGSRRFVVPLWSRWLRVKVRLIDKRRYNRMALEQVAGRSIVVLPEVFNPVLLRSGRLFAESLDASLIPRGSRVLDMGTGSGVGAITATQWAACVVAVDINPAAVRCVRINAMVNGVEDRVEAREGDLFEPLNGERFDVVLFNPPFFRGEPKDALDRAWRSTDVVERFAAGLSGHLTPDGYALVILSTHGEEGQFLDAFREQGLEAEIVSRRDLINEMLTIYRFRMSTMGAGR